MDHLRCRTGRDVRHGGRYSRNLLRHVTGQLAACVSLQALLISVLDYFSDLLDERFTLILQDKLTLDHDLGDLLRVVSIQVKPEGHHLPVVRLQLTLCYPVAPVGYIKDIELRLRELLMA